MYFLLFRIVLLSTHMTVASPFVARDNKSLVLSKSVEVVGLIPGPPHIIHLL